MSKWTNSQKQAIDSKGSVLVSASAGTGKTAVLTEKVVNAIVSENININEMIIMTFSAAAANEMKERIKNRIYELINDENTDRITKNILWKQLRNFGNSNIQTIHAFCNDIIKKYFYIINKDPNIKVADNYDIAILKTKAIEEVMLSEYKNMDELFVALESMTDGTETIEQIIVNSYNKIVSFIDYNEWLQNSIEKYNISDSLPIFIKEMIVNDFNKAIINYEKSIELIDSFNEPKLDKIEATFKSDLLILKNIINEINSDSINNVSNLLTEFGSTVRFPNGDDFDEIKQLRNDARELILSKYKKVEFLIDVQIKRIQSMYPLLLKFKNIFNKFDELYGEMKNEKKFIDFNDMEKYAYEILKNDNISTEYRNLYKRVFIDEYQDTNPMQEAIISRISTNFNLFCVGDLKQSIYRFRSSDPTLFAQRSDKYSKNISLGSIINLNSNFRSAQNILDASNDIFNYITSSSKEINYTKEDMLVHGRMDDSSVTPVEIELLSDEFKNIKKLSNEEIEIYNIVKIIKNNIGTDIYDPETSSYKKIDYKDIVILSRKLSGLTDKITEIFNSNNIPFFIEKAGELLETTEAQILMNIVDLINNPKNDLKIISLMHIGLFGFNDEDIVCIKKTMDKSYYDAMINMSEENEISQKCQKMFSFFDDCREKQKYLSLTSIIDYIISSLHLFDIFAIMRNGNQRIANIREFQKHAYDYENKYGEKLYGFSLYLEQIQKAEVNVEEAKTNFNENSIKITTIHKSKGLEYPIVILAFCNKKFNQMDKRANIVIDKDCGIGVKYYNHKLQEKGKCLFRTYIENAIDDKNIEEEMRLLYVAMTRAKEKLFIQGTISSNSSWDNLSNTNSFLDWIMTTIVHSNQFASQFNKEPDILLKGNWKTNFVEYSELEDFIKSEANEISIDLINNRYNVLTKLNKEEEIVNNEYIPLVLSASGGLKKKEISKNMFISPSFIKSEKDPLYLGTITHEFFKNINFKNCLSFDSFINEKDKLIKNNIMNTEDLNNLDFELLYKFFESTFGKFVISCDSYIKEKNIYIVKDSKEIGYSENEDILVRCIVDLICEKDGKYYLVDYKTDKINNINDDEEITKKALSHKSQLDLYKEALKNVYSINIEKTYISFVNYGISKEI